MLKSQQKSNTMKHFISNFKSAVIGTLDAQSRPFSSYAPFVYDGHTFYIYISDIATHAKNLQANPNASLFFIEDESKTENIFARKRISLQCSVQKIARDAERFEGVLALFEQKFDAGTVGMLRQMADFNLYELEVTGGEATFGFGEAYTVGGEKMDTLIPRRGGGHRTK